MELKGELLACKQHLFGILKNTIANERSKLRFIEQKDVMRNPVTRIYDNRKELIYISERLENLTINAVNDNKNKLGALAGKLDALSPLGVVSRGYALAENKGKLVKSTADISVGDDITLKVSDGTVTAKVLCINEG